MTSKPTFPNGNLQTNFELVKFFQSFSLLGLGALQISYRNSINQLIECLQRCLQTIPGFYSCIINVIQICYLWRFVQIYLHSKTCENFFSKYQLSATSSDNTSLNSYKLTFVCNFFFLSFVSFLFLTALCNAHRPN